MIVSWPGAHYVRDTMAHVLWQSTLATKKQSNVFHPDFRMSLKQTNYATAQVCRLRAIQCHVRGK